MSEATGSNTATHTTDTPQLLLEHHLKELRLPTILREYDKVARQCAAEQVDYARYLLRMTELELLDREKRERAWRAMDKLNATLGRDTVRILGAGPRDAAWKLRAEHRSPRWTTRWDELPKASAK